MPSIIFGENLPALDNISSDILVDVPTSGGVYKGNLRVVAGQKIELKFRMEMDSWYPIRI
jgi:hypothetical protein